MGAMTAFAFTRGCASMEFKEHPMPVLRGASVASISLGFFSMVVFWWYPFGLFLASAGFVIGLFCLICKTRGLYGENLALIGTTLCAIVVSVILTLTFGIRFMMWDH